METGDVNFEIFWLNFVVTHPDEWKIIHSQMMDLTIKAKNGVYQAILKQPNGNNILRDLLGWHKKTPYWFEK